MHPEDIPTPHRRHCWRLALGAMLAAALLTGCKKSGKVDEVEAFTVRPGELDVTVVESGNLEAIESQSIVSQVSRTMKIATIIEEGTNISAEDVKAKKVLVKFDSNQLEDDLYSRESDLESARSSLTEAKEGLLIQKSDNESSVRQAELEVTYATNDLHKLVGGKLANDVMEKEPEDIQALLDHPDLGGQTKQDLDKYRGEIEIARTKLGRAQEKLKFTEALYKKQYVSKNELDTDKLDLRSQELNVQTATSKLDIYRRYEFVKVFQKSWATLLSAREKLDRAKAVARSRLAQAEAKLKNREAGFRRSENRLDDLKKDIENCTIYATQPGFVVYESPPRWQNTGPLQEGSEIRPRQAIIQLPDLSQMGVKVKIQEAQIDMIKPGQTVSITIDAMPDRHFTGKVKKKAVLPSSQSWWANPDLKVYETDIALDGGNPGNVLRPGMTATVEILIEKIENVLRVPIQSVQTDEKGKHYCYLKSGNRVEVTIGKRNQVYVEVLDGVKEGDEVLMTPPELTDGEES
jgi:multidrug efflux pump subunit AcrA (membrane-fusion protein)